jgi:hypothetical protein
MNWYVFLMNEVTEISSWFHTGLCGWVASASVSRSREFKCRPQDRIFWLRVLVVFRLDWVSREKRLLPSSHQTVRMYQGGSQWMDFCKIWYRGLWWKTVEKIQIRLKMGTTIVHFTWRHKYVLLLPATWNPYKSAPFEWNCIKMLVRLSVRLPACKSATPTGLIYGSFVMVTLWKSVHK